MIELTDVPTSLKRITLSQLVETDRILYTHIHPDLVNHYKGELRRYGNDVAFYVPEALQPEIPLRMLLFDNRDSTVIPNQPVAQVEYSQPHWVGQGVQVAERMVEFPFGYHFWNMRRAPAGDKGLYFPENESGWKSDEQGMLLEARQEAVIKEGRIQSIRFTSIYRI